MVNCTHEGCHRLHVLPSSLGPAFTDGCLRDASHVTDVYTSITTLEQGVISCQCLKKKSFLFHVIVYINWYQAVPLNIRPLKLKIQDFILVQSCDLRKVVLNKYPIHLLLELNLV